MAHNHSVDPIWNRFYSGVICRVCRRKVIGDGTTAAPWSHAKIASDETVPETLHVPARPRREPPQ